MAARGAARGGRGGRGAARGCGVPAGRARAFRVAAAAAAGGGELWDALGVQVQDMPGCRVQADVEVPADVVDYAWNSVVERFGAEMDPPAGFRKGAKIPESIVVANAGVEAVKSKVIEEILYNSMGRALEGVADRAVEDSEEILTSYEELAGGLAPGQPLRYSCAVDVTPELKWKGTYEGMEIVVEVPGQTAEDEERAVEQKIREKRADKAVLRVAERGLEMGDSAIVQMTCVKKGTDIPLMQVPEKGFQVDTENPDYIDGFIEEILGMEAGGQKSFDLTIPDDFDTESLRGMTGTFDVSMKEVFARDLPEVDDEFAAYLADGCTTMEEAREKLLEEQREMSRAALEVATQEAVVAQLAELADVELPQSLLVDSGRQAYLTELLEAQAKGALTYEVVQQMSSEPMVMNYVNANEDKLRKMALSSLALDTVQKEQRLEVDREAFLAELESAQKDFKQMDQEFDQQQLENIVTERLQTQLCLEWLVKRSRITVK